MEPGIARAKDAVIYLAGSRFEGLGNRSSDIDVYAITDCRPRGGIIIDGRHCILVQHVVADCRVDWEIWDWPTVDEVLLRLRRLKPGHGRKDAGAYFTYEETVFLHRLRVCAPLIGPQTLNKLQGRCDFAKLATFLAQEVLRTVDHLLDDLWGMLEDEHLQDALIVSRLLADAMVDAWLHHLGNTNPTPKWRVRLLRCQDGFVGQPPPDGTTAERHREVCREWWRSMMNTPDPRSSPLEFSDYCRKLMRRANRVAGWIQG